MSLNANKRKLLVNRRIHDVLMSGRMPSVSEIISSIERTVLQDEDDVTTNATGYRTGNVLSSEHYNTFVQSVENDIETMRMSIDEGWARLEQILLQSNLFTGIGNKAETLNKTAKRMLSTMSDADAYYVGNLIDFSDDSMIDEILSRDYSLDSIAGSVSIAKTGSSVLPNSGITVESVEMVTAAGTPSTTFIGTPDMMLVPTSGRRFIAESYSNDADIYHELTIHLKIADSAAKSRMVTSVVLDSSSIHEQDVVVLTSYDGYNWELLGEGHGNHRIAVSGNRRHVTDIKIMIGKTEADGRRLIGSQFKAVYAFDIDHISIAETSYVLGSEIVTTPIQLTTDGVSSVVVGSDLVVPDGTRARVFVADDVTGATSIDDFTWTEVKNNEVTKVGNVKLDIVKFTVQTAAKIISGIGATSDVWELGDASGAVTDAYAGIDQARVVSVLAADPSATAITLLGPTDGSVSYRDVGSQMTLSGSNLYSVNMNIWSTYSDSISLDLFMPKALKPGTDYRISINGQDITSSYDGSKIGFGITSGRNAFVISIKRLTVTPFTISLGKPAVHRVSAYKPAIVSESNLSGTEPTLSYDNGTIKTSFDPRGMKFEIVEKTITPAFTTGSIRLRASLESTSGACTPTLRSWYIISGG
jgi:hypothetical protein